MAGEGNVRSDRRTQRSPQRNHRPWREVAALAGRQHGSVSHAQLLELGFSQAAIRRSIAAGRLHQIHRGVYAVGHAALSWRGRWMAGTLAVAESALTHPSALCLWRLRDPGQGPVHVTAPRRARQRPGLRVHRRHLPPGELAVRERIPVTSLPRTLLDLAAAEGRRALDRALREARFQHDRRIGNHLAALIARHPGERGVAVARAALVDAVFVSRTRSELEAVFLDFLSARALRRPLTNQLIEVGGERLEVDCLWPEERLIVELDGRAAHDDPRSFEADRRRDALLAAAGYTVYRLTWRRLHEEPGAVADELKSLLRSPAA